MGGMVGGGMDGCEEVWVEGSSWVVGADAVGWVAG